MRAYTFIDQTELNNEDIPDEERRPVVTLVDNKIFKGKGMPIGDNAKICYDPSGRRFVKGIRTRVWIEWEI